MATICEKMYHDPEFRKVHDRFAETHNTLSDKFTEAGIDLKYLNEAINAITDYENYISTFRFNYLLKELNITKEANVSE